MVPMQLESKAAPLVAYVSDQGFAHHEVVIELARGLESKAAPLFAYLSGQGLMHHKMVI